MDNYIYHATLDSKQAYQEYIKYSSKIIINEKIKPLFEIFMNYVKNHDCYHIKNNHDTILNLFDVSTLDYNLIENIDINVNKTEMKNVCALIDYIILFKNILINKL